MTKKRARAEARQRWMREKEETHERDRRVKERVTTVLGKAKFILADRKFVELMRLRGVQSMPRFLTTSLVEREFENANSKPDQQDTVSVEFAVAWCFLSQLLGDAVIARRLEDSWPGFANELKDAFIALVIEGPFPYALSGHSKGWQAAFYNFGMRERCRPLDSNDERLLAAQVVRNV